MAGMGGIEDGAVPEAPGLACGKGILPKLRLEGSGGAILGLALARLEGWAAVLPGVPGDKGAAPGVSLRDWPSTTTENSLLGMSREYE